MGGLSGCGGKETTRTVATLTVEDVSAAFAQKGIVMKILRREYAPGVGYLSYPGDAGGVVRLVCFVFHTRKQASGYAGVANRADNIRQAVVAANAVFLVLPEATAGERNDAIRAAHDLQQLAP